VNKMDWDIRTGDTVVTQSGTYLIVSSESFDLFNDNGEKVNIILVDVERGDMEGYDHSLDDLWKYYNIELVIKNKKSYERFHD
jgi:RNA-binding protein YlmH